MEKYNFEMDAKAAEYEDLFHKGKLLHAEINALDPDDQLVIDDFLDHLTTDEEKAFKLYNEYLIEKNINKPVTAPSTESSIKTPSGEKLTELLDKFIFEKSRNWGEKQAEATEHKDYRPKINLFIEIVGDIYSNELTKEDIVSYKEAMFKIPKSMRKKKEYREKTIPEILQMNFPKADRMSDTTIGHYFSKVSTFLNWCKENGKSEPDLNSPLKNVIKKKKIAQDERDIFTEEELHRLFMNDYYKRLEHKQANHYWVPLLGLLTGARENELCQLYVEDIKKEEGIWIIDINDKKDKKTKNLQSNRKIPIHSILVKELHFIDYVDVLKANKIERLFPELKLKRDGYAQQFSKWFNRTYRKNTNVGMEEDEKKNFHSFRHTFINFYKQRGTEEYLVSEYVGQEANTAIAYGRYGKRQSLKDMKKFIESLKMDFLDFSSIRKWK